MKTAAQDIIDTFRALGNITHLSILLSLAHGPSAYGSLSLFTNLPIHPLQTELRRLEALNLIVRSGAKEKRQSLWKLAPRVTVTDDKLIIDASGLEITIARALKETTESTESRRIS